MSTGLARVLRRRAPSTGTSLAAQLFAKNRLAWFDAATLALSNGAAVTSWADRTGSYTASGGTSPTYVAADQAVSFTKASLQHLRCDALAAALAASPHGVIAHVKRTATSGDLAALGLTVSGTSVSQYHLDVSGSGLGGGSGGYSPTIWTSTPSTGGLLGSTHAAATTTDDALVMWSRAAGSSLTVGCGYPTSGGTVPASSPVWTVGAIGATIYGGSPVNAFGGEIRKLLVYKRALTYADFCAAEIMLGLTGTRRWKLVAPGDSMTAQGTSWLAQYAPPNRCINDSDSGGQKYNVAVSGRTTDDVLAALSTDVTPHYSAYFPTLIPVLCGTNNVYGKQTGTQALAAYWTLLDAIRAACPHAWIIAFTPPRRANWSTSPTYDSSFNYDAELAAFCTGARAGWGAHADAFVDIDADARFQDPSNTTYFSGDLCHPSSAGYLVIRDMINPDAHAARAQARTSARGVAGLIT